VRRDNGVAPASLDPTALLAQESKRFALHRYGCGAALECWNWSPGRFANRAGPWPIGRKKTFASGNRGVGA
jgi:hypothetical protein